MKHAKITAMAMAAAMGMGCLPLNVLVAVYQMVCSMVWFCYFFLFI